MSDNEAKTDPFSQLSRDEKLKYLRNRVRMEGGTSVEHFLLVEVDRLTTEREEWRSQWLKTQTQAGSGPPPGRRTGSGQGT